MRGAERAEAICAQRYLTTSSVPFAGPKRRDLPSADLRQTQRPNVAVSSANVGTGPSSFAVDVRNAVLSRSL